MNSQSSTTGAVIAFAAAVVVTVTFWAIIPERFGQNESADYTSFYGPVAHSIASGKGCVTADDAPAVRYPPGYPLLLAGLFVVADLLCCPETGALRVFGAACAGGSAVLLLLLSRKVWGARLAVWVPVFCWITYLPFLWITKQPNSELPFFLAFFGCILVFWEGFRTARGALWFCLTAGMLAGASMLIRPIAIGLGVILAVCVLFLATTQTRRMRLLLAGVLLCGNALVVAPWEVWAYAKTGDVLLLSSGGAASMRDGLTYAVKLKGFRTGVAVPVEVEALMQRLAARYDSLISPRTVAVAMWKEFRQDPVAVVKLYLIKAARSWYGTDSQRFERPLLLLQLPYLIMLVCAYLRLRGQSSATRRFGVLVGMLTLYFWGMTVLTLSILRYMVPVTGLLFLMLPAVLAPRDQDGPQPTRGFPGGC